MLQFTPAYFFFDKPNLAKKDCSCKRALNVSLLCSRKKADFSTIKIISVFVQSPDCIPYSRNLSHCILTA